MRVLLIASFFCCHLLHTAAQTPVLVKELVAGAADGIDAYGGNIGLFYNNGKIFMQGMAGESDVEWFKYDITGNTFTQLTSGLYPGAGNQTVITNSVRIGTNLFYSGANSNNDYEFYRIDLSTGTASNININNGTCPAYGNAPKSSSPGGFVQAPNGKVYFAANDATDNGQIFSWDAATPNAVTKVTAYNTQAGMGVQASDGLIIANNRLLFGGYTNSVNAGYASFCNNAQTQYYIDEKELLKLELSNNAVTKYDLNTGTFTSGSLTYKNAGDPQSYFTIGNKVYFQARTGASTSASYQLCMIDLGAATPAVQVLSSFTNVQSSSAISNYIYDGTGKLYFTVTFYQSGSYVKTNIYALNTTTNAISAVTNYTTMDESPIPVLYKSGYLYFIVYDTEQAKNYIQKVNTTTNAITNAANSGFATSWFSCFANGNKLFFSGDLGDGAGEELLSYDVTGSTIIRHGDVEAGSNSSYPYYFTQAGNDLYYFAYSSATGTELYKINSVLSTLPVQWVSFTVAQHDQLALLTWKTATEQNNQGFEIQYSTDGQHFEKAGWMAPHGSNSTYTFTHTLHSTGNHYYRIKQVDLDGKASFSDIRKIQTSTANLLAIMGDVNTIKVTGLVNGKYLLSDIQGRLVQKGNVVPGTTTIDISYLTPAVYNISIVDNNGLPVQTKKIIKR